MLNGLTTWLFNDVVVVSKEPKLMNVNKVLIIKAKYRILLSLHWTPLLEPLSVLLPTGP
jgi:hypothetical protein